LPCSLHRDKDTKILGYRYKYKYICRHRYKDAFCVWEPMPKSVHGENKLKTKQIERAIVLERERERVRRRVKEEQA